MKQTFIRQLFMALFLFLCIFSKGQLTPIYNVPGPEVAGLGQYGTVPVSLFTGTPDISIPLYTIKVGEFEMPIKACYHIASVKPTSAPSSLGLGWNLSAGGYITRKVRGIYDEQQDADGTSHGFYDHCYMMQNITYGAFCMYTQNLVSVIGIPYYEVTADEFAFNFCGYTGNFYLNENGGWTVVSDQDIKVEFDETTGFMDLNTFKTRVASISGWERANDNNRFFCRFTIVTPDGCRYEFGGIDAIEFSIPYYARKTNDIFPTTWFLSKITTPEHREITFSYDTSSLMCDIQYVPQTTNVYSTDGYIVPVKSWGKNGFAGFLLYNVNISTITTPNEIISFDYYRDQAYGGRFTSRYNFLYWSSLTDMRRELYLRSEKSAYQFNLFINAGITTLDSPTTGSRKVADLLKSQILHRIKISHGTHKKSIYFGYVNNNHRKLSIITEREGFPNLIIDYTQGEGVLIPVRYRIPESTSLLNVPEYHFTYNELNRITPDYAFADRDSWGYYMGSDVSISDIPYFHIRTSSQAANEAEILKTIKYPTGGTSEFEYQQNRYSKQVNNTHTSLNNVSGSSGGLCVKSITQKDIEGNVVNKKKYYYSFQKNDNATSSGISKGEPCHSLTFYAGNNSYYTESYGGFYFTSTSYNSPEVGYSCVYEETLDKNGISQGYIRYRFSNYDTDIYGNQHLDTQYLYATNANGNSPITPVTSNSLERGKLLSKEFFSADGTVVKKEHYRYALSQHPDMKTAHQNLLLFVNNVYSTIFAMFGWMTNTHTSSYLLESITDSVRGADNTFSSQSTYYLYNSHKVVCQEQKKELNNVKETTTYQYPYDFACYDWMDSLHILSPLVATTNSRGTFTKTIFNEFAPRETQDGIIPYIQRSRTQFGPDETRTDYQVLQTDMYGNPTEVIEGNKTSVLVWDMTGQLLLARMENCTMNEAVSALGEDFSGEYNPWFYLFEYEEIENSRTLLPNAQIHTYQYNDRMQIERETSPNNLSVYYKYDALGRLIREYYLQGGEEKIIKQYDYRYYSGTGSTN